MCIFNIAERHKSTLIQFWNEFQLKSNNSNNTTYTFPMNTQSNGNPWILLKISEFRWMFRWEYLNMDWWNIRIMCRCRFYSKTKKPINFKAFCCHLKLLSLDRFSQSENLHFYSGWKIWNVSDLDFKVEMKRRVCFCFHFHNCRQ